MTNPVLQASVREETGKQLSKVRNAKQLPSVVYGGASKTISIAVDTKAFEEIFRQTGTSGLIDLALADAKPVQVLVHDIQRDPLTNELIHADFYRVDMNKKITADVHLQFVGESKVVKELGGVLIKGVDKVRVEALPHDLVQQIDVDISALKTFDDIIRVSDLPMPSGLVVKEGSDSVVANVKPPRTQAELEALEAKTEEPVGEVEKVGEDKAAGEVGEAEDEAAKKENDTKEPAGKDKK